MSLAEGELLRGLASSAYIGSAGFENCTVKIVPQIEGYERLQSCAGLCTGTCGVGVLFLAAWPPPADFLLFFCFPGAMLGLEKRLYQPADGS